MLKRFVLLFFAAGACSAAFSQVQFGVRAGVNFSNAVVRDADDNKMPTNLLTGFHAGVTAELPLGDEFAVSPGLLFNTKGYQYKVTSDGLTVTVNQHPYYLELPVNFLYKPELGNGRLLLGAGPYLAYGIGGRWKGKGAMGNTTTSRSGSLEFKNDISSTDSSYLDYNNLKKLPYGKPFDVGAALLAGYEFSNKFSVQLNGQMGLLNIAPKVDGKETGERLKNMQFGLSVGYKF
ncbi:porin family protein [Niabella beijingensis]|uniref:porin family protein n=1 Tax=Niabella beijingensis TaxID=2872700 RepID=UPI001CBBCE5C|nr:porin family protein [Niabella beijingensis]MBZ4190086.1 PorT family protein [Niabella beijingensis]